MYFFAGEMQQKYQESILKKGKFKIEYCV